MINWTEIILGVLTLLGCCGWFVSGRKYRLDLSTEFATKFKELIVMPLETEVNRLRNQVNQLKDAIEGINDCPVGDDCPVRHRMRKHSQREVGNQKPDDAAKQ